MMCGVVVGEDPCAEMMMMLLLLLILVLKHWQHCLKTPGCLEVEKEFPSVVGVVGVEKMMFLIFPLVQCRRKFDCVEKQAMS